MLECLVKFLIPFKLYDECTRISKTWLTLITVILNITELYFFLSKDLFVTIAAIQLH